MERRYLGKKEGVLSIRRGRNSKLHGQHISTYPGRRQDLIAHGFNVSNVPIVLEVCCAMHLNNGFVLTKPMVAVLQVKGKRLVCIVLDEDIAWWALDQVVNVLGLVAVIPIISPGWIALELTLDAYLSPGISRLKGGQLVVVRVVDERHAD